MIILALFLVLLSSITYLRLLPGWSSIAENAPWSELVQGSLFSFVLVWHFYNNIVGNIPSTDRMFDNPASSIYPGENTFMDIYKFLDTIMRAVFGTSLFPNGYWVLKVIEHQSYLPGYGIFNTASHLAYYYSDFGEAGVIMLSFLLGLFASYTYKRAVLFKKLYDVQIAAMFMTAIVYSIRGVLYGGVNFWLTFFLIMFQYRSLQRINRGSSRFGENRSGTPSAECLLTEIT
jgi:hypothetical protein